MKREEIKLRLELECGATLEDAPLVYHTSGVRTGRVIWICHALTANSNPEEWWPEMVGPGMPIDTERNFVVCANMLGSAYGSAGPATLRSDTGRLWLLDFPDVTIRDSVAAFISLRKHLGIDKIDLLIGASNGGFHAIEWAVTEPDVFKRCVFVTTAPRISPFLGATVEAQRMALEADPTFREAASISGGEAGLRCARAQALISYRSFKCFSLSQSEPDPDTLFAGRVASYERYQGAKLVARGFDAYSYYNLCRGLDSHNVGRGRGGVAAALGRITARVSVVSIDSDLLFPPDEGRSWASLIPGADFQLINSDYGHDGFLLETAKLSPILVM